MANFTKENFILPVSPGDSQIFLKDRFGKIRHIISPNKIVATIIRNNLINIRTIGDDDILVDFGNVEEAKLSLVILQTQIDIAKKSILSFGATGPIGPIGPTGATGPKGEIGPTGVSLYFSYHQILATNSWGITHSLGYNPNVMITNDLLEEIEGLIKYIDNSQLYVKFNQNITGWVFCN
jgi:hypothetical protein